MKRFHFPLRPLAVVRAHRELRAREALAGSLRQRQLAEVALAAAHGRVGALETVIATGRSGSFRAADQAAYGRAYGVECAAAAAQGLKLAAAEREVATRREACVEANRQLKIVSRLEEKARAVHRVELLRAEQTELDDVSSSRRLRQKISP